LADSNDISVSGNPAGEVPFRPNDSQPRRPSANTTAYGRGDRLAEGPAVTVPPAGPPAEAEDPEFDGALFEPAEALAPPPLRRQPGGRLPRRLTEEEALRLDRCVKGAYLDRALLRNR
jgi:hypothetical protein